MLGYVLSGPDNDSYAGDEAPAERRCEACGYIADRGYLDSSLTINRRVYDFSHTYDYACIVSRKFFEFCHRAGYAELKLVSLPSDPDFFMLTVTAPPVPFDSERRGTRFEGRCSKCGVFDSVVGAHPAYLRMSALPQADGFFRTDLEFGSGNEKSPLIIVAPATQERLRAEGFAGLEFEPVEGAV